MARVAEEVVQDLPDALRIAVQVGVAADARAGRSPQVAAEVSAADEKFEIVSSGAAITLLAEGNADIYSREGIACIPVNGLEPARLAIAWATTGPRSATSSRPAARPLTPRNRNLPISHRVTRDTALHSSEVTPSGFSPDAPTGIPDAAPLPVPPSPL